MVGEDQDQCGSVMLIESPPEASASFTFDLLERIREELFDEGKSLSQRGQYPLFRYASVPFSGGSDHYIFSDPSVGVPMPMLIQWPDRFYHTTADTIDKVSPETLARSCLLAGTYVYWLATAGPREVEWLAHEMTARFKRRVVIEFQTGLTAKTADNIRNNAQDAGPPWHERLNYWLDRQRAAFKSLRRLQPDLDPRPWSRAVTYFATSEWAAIEDLLQDPADQDNLADTDLNNVGQNTRRVPRRLVPGPIWESSLLRQHSPELADRLRELQKTHKDLPRILPTLALYWANGQRTLADIVRQVELESAVRAPDYIAGYFEILAELGTIEW